MITTNIFIKLIQILFVIVVLGFGIYMTIMLDFVQVKYFARGWKKFFRNEETEKGLSSFQAASIAIGGRIGTGNIAGVAIAIYYGGYGAIFWMWVAAFFGMAISFCETTLSQTFRQIDDTGHYASGPMTYIQEGLGKKYTWLSVVYGSILVMTVGFSYIALHTQTITMSIVSFAGLNGDFKLEMVIAIFLALGVGFVMYGGTHKVAQVSSYIVPVMIISYILLVSIVAVEHLAFIPEFFKLVVSDAFTPSAVVGGGVGSVLAIGVTVSTFSSEAGYGTATLAAGLADVDHPIKQSLVNMITIFIDVVICTMTAFVIILALTQDSVFIDIKNTSDIAMQSFGLLYDGGDVMLLLFTVVFTFTTILASITYGTLDLKKIMINRSHEQYQKIVKVYVTIVLGLIIATPVFHYYKWFKNFNMVIYSGMMLVFINIYVIFRLRKVIFGAFKQFKVDKDHFDPHAIGIENENTNWD